VKTSADRDKIIAQALKKGNILYLFLYILIKCQFIGLQIGACGDATIRFRPALIFQPKHVEIGLGILNDIAKTF